MALTPSANNPDRKSELKRAKENPEDFGNVPVQTGIPEKPKDWDGSGSNLVPSKAPAPVAESADDPIQKMVESIAGMDADDKSLWDGKGKPKPKALEEASGIKGINAKQRDEAWKLYQEGNKE